MYPAASAVLLICEVSFAYVQVSAAYPKSIGFWQAMLIIQAFSSSVISAFLPRPGASKSAFSYSLKKRLSLNKQPLLYCLLILYILSAHNKVSLNVLYYNQVSPALLPLPHHLCAFCIVPHRQDLIQNILQSAMPAL